MVAIIYEFNWKQYVSSTTYIKLEEENRKLKEERDFFKEQAILWRKDYKNEYEKNKKLEERIEELNKMMLFETKI